MDAPSPNGRRSSLCNSHLNFTLTWPFSGYFYNWCQIFTVASCIMRFRGWHVGNGRKRHCTACQMIFFLPTKTIPFFSIPEFGPKILTDLKVYWNAYYPVKLFEWVEYGSVQYYMYFTRSCNTLPVSTNIWAGIGTRFSFASALIKFNRLNRASWNSYVSQ